jgi:hypothetical protein
MWTNMELVQHLFMQCLVTRQVWIEVNKWTTVSCLHPIAGTLGCSCMVQREQKEFNFFRSLFAGRCGAKVMCEEFCYGVSRVPERYLEIPGDTSQVPHTDFLS